MLTHCARNLPLLRRALRSPQPVVRHPRRRCSAPPGGQQQDEVASFLQLCVDSHYVSPGERNMERFQQGTSCSYGPLGVELKRNLLERWWHSMSSSPLQVFGINTVHSAAGGQEQRFRVVEAKDFEDVLGQEHLSKEKLVQKVRELLQRSSSLRASLFQGWFVCLHVLLEWGDKGNVQCRRWGQGLIKEAQLLKTIKNNTKINSFTHKRTTNKINKIRFRQYVEKCTDKK